jgi:hypothetical protein
MHTRPDPIDFRDRMYSPTLRPLRPSYNDTPWLQKSIVVQNQDSTSACTGFALAAMIERLLKNAKRTNAQVSPYMLYYFARKYDELSVDDVDGGSTARGAMKAWHKHGACHKALWPKSAIVTPPKDQKWSAEAFHRPLGAYYRVNHTSIADIHAAIEETGLVYATAQVHQGWDDVTSNGLIQLSDNVLGGHAFLIVGYDEHGFWIQNSWGPTWAKKGYARVTYQDWRLNAMDAWVGQIGVHISSALATITSGMKAGSAAEAVKDVNARKTMLSSNPSVAAQQVNPYIVNIGDNGFLSRSGQFSTTQNDLNMLVSHYLKGQKKQLTAADGKIHVALYAHGGLVSEDAASDTAMRWVPFLLKAGIFPVFFMWETGVIETLNGMIANFFDRDKAAAAGSFWGSVQDWMDDRVEGLVSGLGTAGWDEIKGNAEQATDNDRGAMRALHTAFMEHAGDMKKDLKFHLIGHSAGSIFHAWLLPALLSEGFDVDGVYWMAPALRNDVFQVLLDSKCFGGKHGAKVFAQYHLRDDDERDDNCRPLPYNKSLLYLVSNAFERKRKTPILGMEKYAQHIAALKPNGMDHWEFITSRFDPRRADPLYCASSSSHGGFSSDEDSMRSIATWIHKRMNAASGVALARTPPRKRETAGRR